MASLNCVSVLLLLVGALVTAPGAKAQAPAPLTSPPAYHTSQFPVVRAAASRVNRIDRDRWSTLLETNDLGGEWSITEVSVPEGRTAVRYRLMSLGGGDCYTDWGAISRDGALLLVNTIQGCFDGMLTHLDSLFVEPERPVAAYHFDIVNHGPPTPGSEERRLSYAAIPIQDARELGRLWAGGRAILAADTAALRRIMEAHFKKNPW